MRKILDEFSALGKGMFTHLRPMHPRKKGVFSHKFVAVYIDEGKKTVDKFVENIVSLLGNIVLACGVTSNL